jgi:hypothetical protein
MVIFITCIDLFFVYFGKVFIKISVLEKYRINPYAKASLFWNATSYKRKVTSFRILENKYEYDDSEEF